MTNLGLKAVRPSPGAYTAEPLTAGEIDAHPDADRIWATIIAVRNEFCTDPDAPSWYQHGN